MRSNYSLSWLNAKLCPFSKICHFPWITLTNVLGYSVWSINISNFKLRSSYEISIMFQTYQQTEDILIGLHISTLPADGAAALQAAVSAAVAAAWSLATCSSCWHSLNVVLVKPLTFQLIESKHWLPLQREGGDTGLFPWFNRQQTQPAQTLSSEPCNVTDLSLFCIPIQTDFFISYGLIAG